MGRIRTLPERRVLVALGLILLVGFGLRLIGVFDPIDSSYQGADAARYERIAALLYTDQQFAVPGSDAPYDWSPGAPLFYAGIYYVTGGVHPALGRLAIALLGLVTIVICFLLGRRLQGSAAGLLAALLAATYPAFVFNTGRLLSEPIAEVTVPGAVLAFLWALDRRAWWAWAAPGVLIGLSALVRPEYLLFGLAFALLALIKRGPVRALVLAAAFALPIAPWALHVSSEVGRFVPVTTGAGKALFIGSYLPGDGIHDRVKIELMERYLGMRNVTPEQRARQPMEPLLDRVAKQYPDLPRDAALNRIGRENLSRYAREQPLAVAEMMANKMRWMWRGSSGAMLSAPAVALQVAIVLLAIAGLVDPRGPAALRGAAARRPDPRADGVLGRRARRPAPQPRADAAGHDARLDRPGVDGGPRPRRDPGPRPAAEARAVTAVAATTPRAWAARHGVLIALAVIVVIGLALRVDSALEPLDVRPGTDSAVYASVAEQLYEHQRFALPGAASPYDWSPGAPLFYASIYYATGGVHPGAVRLVVALLGALTIVLVFLLGRRLAGPLAGLAGAALFAIYPVTIFFTGKLMSEPLATLTLTGAVLSFFWAGDPGRPRWTWAVPGVLLGLTAFARPEYLAFILVFAVIALFRRGPVAAAILTLAFAVPILPWTLHVSNAEGRFVPISTGGGKALFIGTYLPGDGLHLDVKRELLRQFEGREDIPATELSRISMTPLLNRVASKYPDLERDAALQKIGRENAERYLTEQPLDFAGMVGGKMWHMWHGSGAAGRSTYGTIFQFTVLALGLAGLVLLAVRRRWEFFLIAGLLVGVTVVGGLLLAGTRRNVTLMPLVMALAGFTVFMLAQRVWPRLAGR